MHGAVGSMLLSVTVKPLSCDLGIDQKQIQGNCMFILTSTYDVISSEKPLSHI